MKDGNSMESDKHKIDGNVDTGQATLLLQRLETLRGELGAVGEELIALLREAGAAPPATDLRKKVGRG